MTGLRNVADHFSLIRSKNAGPFMLTLDLFFVDGYSREAFLRSGVVDSGFIAELYGVDPAAVQRWDLPDIDAMKISFPRPVASGEFGDTDITGGQQHALLVEAIAELEITGSGADIVVSRPRPRRSRFKERARGMSDSVGAPLGEPGYRLVDADAHINEPPDLWTGRLPAKFKDRAPRVQRFEQGDAWVMDGVKDPINFGSNVSAGTALPDRSPWVRWEDIRPGGHDPKARLLDMDADLVDAAVLFPTPRISQLVIANPDPKFHLAMVMAYNDWLSEYCEHDPSRLGGVMLVPNRGVEDAVREVQRVIGRPGIVGCLIGCYPHGDLDLAEEDDPVWQEIAGRDVPVHIHVSLVNECPRDIYAPGTITEGLVQGYLRFRDVPGRMLQFLEGEVFDRVPDLKIVLAEVDAGWVPYVKEQVDNRVLRRRYGADMRGRRLPSSVIAEHFYYTYVTDHFAIRNRHAIGVDRLMWSSDFPHGGSDWPGSIRVIHADFADVAARERDLILAGNAQRLYRFRP